MPKRILDTRAYVSALRELVESGKEVGMRISGSSMAPFLVHERDDIFFKKPDAPLKKGDMVFFQRTDGAFVMHRICRVTPQGYDIIGDAHDVIEPNIRREQIFAIVTKVRRKGKIVEPGDFLWEFFRVVWLRIIPIRRPLMKGYAKFKKLFRH